MANIAEGVVGEDQVERMGAQLTGSEDFAFMLEKVPGTYFLIGNGAGDQAGACMVHNPSYDFNDENIDVASKLWAALVNNYLN